MLRTRPLSAIGVAAAALSSTALAETRDFDATGFDSIKATAGVEVIVEVGGDFSVSLEADGELDRAYVELEGDTLVLGRQGRTGMNWGGADRFVYTVSMPDFVAGEATAGSDLTISGINGGAIELSSSAGSDLEAEGTCETLEASASSGSDIKAFELVCTDVKASASSGADIEVHATGSIEARASSGADIRVRGNPTDKDTRKSSGGSVQVSD